MISKNKDIGIAGLLFFLSGLAAVYAFVPFTLKFLVDVFITHLPFWSAFFYNMLMFIMTEIVAVLCMILFGGIAAVKMKKGVNKP